MAEKKKVLGRVKLERVRLSFAALHAPQKDTTNDKGEVIKGKYKANFLMKKGTKETKENLARIKAASEEVKAAKWGDNPPKLKPERLCLRDGDQEDWEGYEGCFYLSSSSKDRPKVVGLRKDEEVEPGHRHWPLSGYYVNAVVTIWAQDNKSEQGGKRINASLEAIQFVQKAEEFGRGHIDTDEYFDDLDDEADSDFDEDEDEDEAPCKPAKKKRPVDEEEEEDEAPRKPAKKKRPVDEDEDDDLM
jgi:hypothetical protein